MKTIPIIDLFAGPGGLGEGFSSFSGKNLKFKIALSIEKDPHAYKTLRLRSFFRQFTSPPQEYYDYVQGNLSLDDLYKRWPKQADMASQETWLHELTDGDIGQVQERVKNALSKHKSKHWVLIGGPPCQAYSIVGRARMKNHIDNFESDERHFLYRHYLRIVAHLSPSIFVMENVKGILTASSKGVHIFERILSDLKCPGFAVKTLDGTAKSPSTHKYDIYSLVVNDKQLGAGEELELKPSDYIIHSEKFGIPQRRHRVILLGIRRDVDPRIGKTLLPSENIVSAGEVLDDLPPLRSGVTRQKDSYKSWKTAISEIFHNPNANEIDKKTFSTMKKQFLMVKKKSRGATRVERISFISNPDLASWYHDKKLTFVLNHLSKSHMKEDLWRYFFASSFNLSHNKSPLLTDYPSFLLPNHKNATPENRKFLDRFKVQCKNKPASTVTSHISRDGHFFIHHAPDQCRAWTVREAARIQTFPDNYFFEGNQTQQYQQVGNAVPPLLAFQISKVVAENIKAMK